MSPNTEIPTPAPGARGPARRPDQPGGRERHGAPRSSGARLLAGWYETGRAAALREHLARYGPAPLAGRGRHDTAPLIEQVDQAGLTGRGGAAFPTGRKLRSVAQAGGGRSVVVANGMESEPASGKDRTLLRLAPHLVLDGIALAADAVGAQEAHLCLPRTAGRQIGDLDAMARDRWQRQIDPIPVSVHALPHHYVSSEETSLVRWLDGGPARPASVPPRPFERGVAGLPTLIDNVETLAHLALIARYGPAWFRSLGAPDSPGTTLVTLTGALTAPGVYEVELGTALRDVIELGGPDAPGAVLLGGFFGSWHPIEQAVTLRYSAPAIAAAGGGIGAGVVSVLPQGVCGLAETARVLEFLAGQSARQCGPCRFGLPATAQDFSDLAWGRIGAGQYRRLEEHIGLLAGRGACKHPDGASRFAASALRTFAGDVRRHLADGPCRAARAAQPVLPVPRRDPIEDGDWR